MVVFAEWSVDDALLSGHMAVHEGQVFLFNRPALEEFSQVARGPGIFRHEHNAARFAVQPIDEVGYWLAGGRRSQVESDAADQTGALIGLGGMTYQARRLVDHEQLVILIKNLEKLLHKQSRLFDDADSHVRNSLSRDVARTDFFAVNFVKKLAEPEGRLRFGQGAVLLLVVLAVYWPALHGQFVWDDALLVDRNPLAIGTLKLTSVWFRTDFALTLVVLWLEWLVWGSHPAGYHAVNVLLHALSAVLLWRVLLKLKIPGAWFAALIFAVHPVCVESVAWISEMKNTLSLPFYLLSIWCYLRFEEVRNGERSEEGGQKPSTIFYLLSLSLFVLALMSKTSTVMLPVVLLGCAWWQRGRVARPDAWQTSPFFLLALAFGLLSVWFQKSITTAPVQTENFWGRLAGAGQAVWFYLGKSVWPAKLCMIYPRWMIDAAAPTAYLPLLLLGCALVVCWRFRRGWGRAALFGLGYFTVTLFPAMGFFDMYYLALSRVADHFQYLPTIGIAALAAAGLINFGFWILDFGFFVQSLLTSAPTILRQRFRVAVSGVAATTLIVALSLLSMQRARVLARDEPLWRDTLAKNPAAWTAYNNLGCLLAEQKKYNEAIEQFLASLRLNPSNPEAHSNLGRALAETGRVAEAESHFQTALALRPQNAGIQKSFASFLAEHGKIEEAVSHLREAVRLEPVVQTRLQLAELLHRTGDDRGAVAQYRKVLAAKPDSQDALNNLAWVLATSPDATVRDGKEAVRVAERACRLTRYTEVRPLGTLAAAYAEAARFNEAVTTGQKALELATAAGEERLAAVSRQLLDYYRAGKAWHEPMPKKNEK